MKRDADKRMRRYSVGRINRNLSGSMASQSHKRITRYVAGRMTVAFGSVPGSMRVAELSYDSIPEGASALLQVQVSSLIHSA